jgi:hypothetical protein
MFEALFCEQRSVSAAKEVSLILMSARITGHLDAYCDDGSSTPEQVEYDFFALHRITTKRGSIPSGSVDHSVCKCTSEYYTIAMGILVLSTRDVHSCGRSNHA